MDWKKVAGLVGQAAPILGTALGGPMGGAAGSLVASVLGVDNTPDAVAQAIKQDPQAAIKIKQLELEHSTELARIAFQTLDVELKDTQNARENHKFSMMPGFICVSMTLIVSAFSVVIFTSPIPDANNEIAYLLFGSVLAKWGDSIAYWVGTTRSSAEKDRRR